jgi:carbon starvation protein
MVKEELNTPAGVIASLAILAIMVILLAVLGLVVVKALAESPWGIFTVAATIPIALFMGGYLRFWRIGKVMEASAIGVVLLLLAVWGGKLVHESAYWSGVLGLKEINLAWAIIIYGLAASILPVWLLLAPRDYLSTFMKLGTIFALAVGILVLLPDLQMPALTKFVDGSGPVVAGKVFPFCFITIACGAISGFHTLIASGTTPKIITRESYARPIGYGAMCLESLVAIMALIAACTLEPGVYLSMNMKGEAAATVAKVNAFGPTYQVSTEQMDSLAKELGEKSLFGRTGGAATLAVGMAHIFSKAVNFTKAVNGQWLDLWYHFAIMFEALFILTTIDAGTRVGRYILQDFLGGIWKPLGDTKKTSSNLIASAVMVCGWGCFLIQGVRDPLGGINSLWPLFGIANQMLAAIALCLATTILLKMQLLPGADRKSGKPMLALITLIPLFWLLSATMTAGVQKIWHSDPRIGFLAQAAQLFERAPALEQQLSAAKASGDTQAIAVAEKALRTNLTLRFNQKLDALVAGTFLVLITIIVLMSIREWILLLARRKIAELRETPPTWLPDYAIAESRPTNLGSLLALTLALVKEVSGEAHLERAQQEQLCCCEHSEENHVLKLKASAESVYVEATEQRFNGIRRCC